MTGVRLFTDGSTYPSNPGHGGVGCVFVHGDNEKQVVRSYAHPLKDNTTNNYSETQAVAFGLRLLRKPCKVYLYTDSQYVMYGLKRILSGKPMLETNQDAWQSVKHAIHDGGHKVIPIKLESHAQMVSEESVGNALADKLAGYSARKSKPWDKYYSSLGSAYDDRPTRKTE